MIFVWERETIKSQWEAQLDVLSGLGQAYLKDINGPGVRLPPYPSFMKGGVEG